MKNIKEIALILMVALVVGVGFNLYYGHKLKGLNNSIRQYREKTEKVITVQNGIIGEYTYSLATLENDLKDAHSISDDQKKTIDILQKDLDIKVDEMAMLSVELDSVKSIGVAEIIIMPDENSITYRINEHKDGYALKVELEHPTGDYNYVIKQDPLTMEIYLARESKTDYRVGTIRFPNNPGVKVTKWDILYDPETRPWYQRFWEDMHLDLGAFGGNTVGITTMVGYKRVTAGPVFTEEGLNLGFVYRVK